MRAWPGNAEQRTGRSACVPALLAVVFVAAGLALPSSADEESSKSAVERFNASTMPRGTVESEGPVCEVQAAGGPAAAAEQDVAALHQMIQARVGGEMKPGVGGVEVDPATVLLNNRGYNYMPTRAP